MSKIHGKSLLFARFIHALGVFSHKNMWKSVCFHMCCCLGSRVGGKTRAQPSAAECSRIGGSENRVCRAVKILVFSLVFRFEVHALGAKSGCSRVQPNAAESGFGDLSAQSSEKSSVFFSFSLWASRVGGRSRAQPSAAECSRIGVWRISAFSSCSADSIDLLNILENHRKSTKIIENHRKS